MTITPEKFKDKLDKILDAVWKDSNTPFGESPICLEPTEARKAILDEVAKLRLTIKNLQTSDEESYAELAKLQAENIRLEGLAKDWKQRYEDKWNLMHKTVRAENERLKKLIP